MILFNLEVYQYKLERINTNQYEQYKLTKIQKLKTKWLNLKLKSKWEQTKEKNQNSIYISISMILKSEWFGVTLSIIWRTLRLLFNPAAMEALRKAHQEEIETLETHGGGENTDPLHQTTAVRPFIHFRQNTLRHVNHDLKEDLVQLYWKAFYLLKKHTLSNKRYVVDCGFFS